MKQVNIPIFVPHLGCPCQCTFCNQRTITGVMPMTAERAREVIEAHLATIPPHTHTELAFFGGSFTAIRREDMVSLLQTATPYLADGQIRSVRISTRPDAIDSEILSILSAYGVTTVELGIQSIGDEVLCACQRGHTATDSYRAAELILQHGLTLGGQMMIGLPASTPEWEKETARAIVAMGAKEARIYPTVVFAHTPLAVQMQRGLYTPLSVEEAVERTVTPLEIFEKSGVKLLRVGLCESEGLRDSEAVLGGAYHPAMGELCYNALYLRRISALLGELAPYQQSTVKITVAPGKLSMAIGQKRRNLLTLQENFGIRLKFAEDPELEGFAVDAALC